MHLRPVIEAEIDALAALWHEGWQIAHARIVPKALLRHRTLDTFRARITRDVPSFYVAEAEGRIVGFIRIVGDELDQFYVAPGLMGQGVAAPLMSLAEDALRARGVTRAHLIASVGNDRAIRFYERQGWANCGEQEADVTTLEGPFRLTVVRFEKPLN